MKKTICIAAFFATVLSFIPELAFSEPKGKPGERLTFIQSIKTKKGKVQYQIYHDSVLNKPCYISSHSSNIKAQDEKHYCIPFSGDEKDLTHPLAATETASRYENYAYCADNIKPEKRNIPGLAGFFKAFNPTYYASDLARFIDDPFQIHKPKTETKSKHSASGVSYHFIEKGVPKEEACAYINDLIPNPFITKDEYEKYHLSPGVVFLTASAAEGEKALHQYWQVIDGRPEEVCVNEWETFDECTRRGEEGCSGGNVAFHLNYDEIVQVKDLNSKEIYQLLMPQILAGMDARNKYCAEVNTSFLDEARRGNWVRILPNTP